jgi:hypothetical protein
MWSWCGRRSSRLCLPWNLRTRPNPDSCAEMDGKRGVSAGIDFLTFELPLEAELVVCVEVGVLGRLFPKAHGYWSSVVELNGSREEAHGVRGISA